MGWEGMEIRATALRSVFVVRPAHRGNPSSFLATERYGRGLIRLFFTGRGDGDVCLGRLPFAFLTTTQC